MKYHEVFIQENAFENFVCEMVAILSRPQCVNAHTYDWSPFRSLWCDFRNDEHQNWKRQENGYPQGELLSGVNRNQKCECREHSKYHRGHNDGQNVVVGLPPEGKCEHGCGERIIVYAAYFPLYKKKRRHELRDIVGWVDRSTHYDRDNWSPCWRRLFEMHFREWESSYFESLLVEFVPTCPINKSQYWFR